MVKKSPAPSPDLCNSTIFGVPPETLLLILFRGYIAFRGEKARHQWRVMSLLEQLLGGGEETLKLWCEDRVSEGLYLEFKAKADPTDPTPSRDDRRHLGEALSAFSNADGGLLLWGIAGEQDRQTRLDYANELSPISNISHFEQTTRTLTAQYLSAPRPEIEAYSIPSTQKPGAGYLAIHIPRSQSRPHMSTAPGHHTYYRRTMVGNIPLEHYEIVDLINAQRTPQLSVIFYLVPVLTDDHGITTVKADLYIRNDGTVLAKYPFIRTKGRDKNGRDHIWQHIPSTPLRPLSTNDKYQRQFVAGADTVVHPDMEIPVEGRLFFARTADNQLELSFNTSSPSALRAFHNLPPLCINGVVGCEHLHATPFEVELNWVQLEDQILDLISRT